MRSNSDRPDAILDSLEPLEVFLGGVPFRDLIEPAYAELSATQIDEPDAEQSE